MPHPALLLFALAACGGQDTPVQPAPADPPGAPVPAAPEPPPPEPPPPVAPPATLGLATHCTGEPAASTWVEAEIQQLTLAPDQCGLPVSGTAGDPLAPWSTAPGWVDLNVAEVSCGEEASAAERAHQVPAQLYLRGPGKLSARARIMQGVEEGGGFEATGWTDWRSLGHDDGPYWTLPTAFVMGGAGHWVQLELTAVAPDGTTTTATWELISPLNC